MPPNPIESTSTIEPDGLTAPAAPTGGSRIARLSLGIIRWFSPLRAWRDLKLAQSARKNFAAGLAIGVFIACLPVYGLQTVLSLYAARRFSIHPLSVIAGSQLSAPPIGPVLSVASIIIGHVLIFGKVPHIPNWHNIQLPRMSLAVFETLVASWVVGGILLGIALAGLTYAIAGVALRLMFARSQCKP